MENRNLLRWLASALVACLLASCNAFGPSGVDLGALADDVQFARETVAGQIGADLSPAAQARLKELGGRVEALERALRLAAAGGPVADVRAAAHAALTLADHVVVELRAEGHRVGSLPLWIDVVRTAVFLIEQGEKPAAVREAMKAKEQQAEQAASSAMPGGHP